MRAPLCLIALLVALLAVPAASAEAAAFGPDLASATPDYAYGCGLVWASQGCTVQDPLSDDMELVLADPVVNGNQTGVVTAIHVKSAATAPAQFVVVEWSGRPGEGNPFPSGVMAVSQQVTLRPGMNNFNTNLPVDRRLADNGFESWSVVSLNILDGTSPIPAQSGGAFATMGVLLDNGLPLTQTTADLTAVPHNVTPGGLPPGRLLMTGDVTITTPRAGGGAPPVPTVGPGAAATPPTSRVALPARARLGRRAASVALRCVGAAACTGTLRIQSRPAPAAGASSAARKARPITYARGSFSIAAGGKRSVKVRLTRSGRKAARRHRSLRAYANVRSADGGTASARITLRR